MTRRNSVVFLIGIVLGAIGGWALFSEHGFTSKATQVRQGGFLYINPLLECEVGEELIANELTPFKSEVQEKVEEILDQKRATHISVYFRDLNNGPWFGINEREEFVLASLVKVPIMISYFMEAEHAPGLLDRMIPFTGSINPNVQYFKPEKVLEVGKSYSVRELIERMIIYSDNDARDLLVLNAKKDQIESTFSKIGAPLPSDRIQLTVKAYASFFRILFNASYISQAGSEEALSVLSKIEFDKGIGHGVPPNVKVAHKFGEKWNPAEGNEKQLHDCGIVYFPNHPYLLCLMTRGDDFNELASVLSDLSMFVYKEVDDQF